MTEDELKRLCIMVGRTSKPKFMMSTILWELSKRTTNKDEVLMLEELLERICE